MTASTESTTKLRVYISANGTTRPTESDWKQYVHPTRIIRRAGGVLEAELVDDLGGLNEHLENLSLNADSNRQCEIWTVTKNSNNQYTRQKRLFWGEILQQSIEISATERSVVRAMVIPQHYGESAKGQLQYNPFTEGVEIAHYDLEFNPKIDGEIINNMFPAARVNNDEEYAVWIDPESTKSQTALDEVFGDGSAGSGDNAEWTVNDIVETLQEWLNADETNITNLDSADIDTAISSPPVVRDLILPRFAFLPTYLTAVLNRHGYGWYLDPTQASNDEVGIQIYKRGEGTERTVKLQARGEEIDLTETRLTDFRLDVALDTISNRLHLFGAYVEREITIDLYRAWATADDGTSDDTDNDNPVGRKWVAGEAGDLIGLRTEIPSEPIWFGNEFATAKRRVIDDCLTLRDGQRRPVLVEYTEDPTAGTPTWTDAAAQDANDETVGLSTNFNVLPDQIGIYFTGALDSRLLDDNDNFRLRITGTILADRRIEYRTDKDDESANDREMELSLDVSDRFFDRQRLSVGSDADSLLTGDADTRDDTSAIETYGDALLEQETLSQMAASITLLGIDTNYEIGDVITEVEGRSISLNRSASSAASPRYLQVVGIEYSIRHGSGAPGQVSTISQRTTLIVEPYDV